MRIVILCGGSGTRLWPLSTPDKPKQFQKLFAGHNNVKYSMAERIWDQLKESGLEKISLICTGRDYMALLKDHVSEAELIEEPSSRNTFPAIALACTYLMDIKKVSPNEPVIIIPIDSYVDETFFSELRKLPVILETSGSDVVLMGKKPQSAATKFGYILTSELRQGYMKVAGFHEKPEEEFAQALLESGALWNMGVFCMRTGLLHEKHDSFCIPKSYATIYENYDQLPKISFDHKVLEHMDSLAVVSFDGLWRDLGTWDDLLDVLDISSNSNAGNESCRNTFILNKLAIPIICSEVDNLAVIASEEGILIIRRNKT